MATNQKEVLTDVESLEREFNSIESRLVSEIKKIEEEMARFRENMSTYEPLFSLDSESEQVETKEKSLSRPFIMEDLSKGRNLDVRFDVKDYSADEVLINIEDDRLIVHAKSKDSDKEFKYQVSLPKDTKLEQLKRFWSADGILSIEGFLPAALRA
ncbi:body wall muscle protein HR-29-like [Centruroides vittatus]|uniref:body wall muscle protein HR-29-like n=1 Tax=Centruroides vittatus TaxID=120091 RepID=UPI00350F86D1